MKAQIRKTLISFRKEFEPELLVDRFATLKTNTLNLLESLEVFKARNLRIAGYIPLNNEVDCIELLREVQRRDASKTFTFYLPKVTDFQNSLMKFYRFDPAAFDLKDYVRAKVDFAPKARDLLFESRFDLVLTPLVGFDKHCNRLGFGKGFYDRFFDGRPETVKVGLAFEFQKIAAEFELFNDDVYNVPLAYVVTEEQVYSK